MSKAFGAGGLNGNETVSLNIGVFFSTSDAHITSRRLETYFFSMNGEVSVSDLFRDIVVSSGTYERHKHHCEVSQFPGRKWEPESSRKKINYVAILVSSLKCGMLLPCPFCAH